MTAEEQTKQVEAKALLTLDVVSRDVRCLVDALHLLAEADMGRFKYLKKILRSDSFTDPTTESNKKTNDYFGGQNVNEVLSAAAQRPTEKFQYLPYNPYAQTAYGDEVSKAYSGDITLEKALENYANKLAEQGKQQGYNVTVK